MKTQIVKFEDDTFGIRKGGKLFGYHYLVRSRGIGRYEWKWIPHSDIDHKVKLPYYEKAVRLLRLYDDEIAKPKKVLPDYGTPYERFDARMIYNRLENED
jgi:hypothetical protein